MKIACSFLIVCLFAACCPPRQAVSTVVEVPVIVRDTVPVPVPVYRDTGSVVILPAGNYDSLFFQWEKQWTEVIMSQDSTKGKRTYRVTSGNRPDTVWIEVILHDTVKVEVVQDCPEALPDQSNGFPWAALGALVALLLVWGVSKKKKK